MVKCLPEFEYFYCVLEKKNIIFKIRRSKVTDDAALRLLNPKDTQYEILFQLTLRFLRKI